MWCDCRCRSFFVKRHATDPFPAVAESAYTLDIVRAGVGRGEEVPECVWVFSEVIKFLSGEEGDFGVFGMFKGHLMAERYA